MTKELWDDLNAESTIEGYGVMISAADTEPNGYIGNHTFKEEYATAIDLAGGDIDDAIDLLCDNTKIFNFSKTGTPYLYEAANSDEYDVDTYSWNLGQKINSPQNLTRTYVAIAYIRTANGLVFLDEERTSVKEIAARMIAGPEYNEESLDGSLNYLANLA